MKRIYASILLSLAAILAVGCARTGDLAYFHDAQRNEARPIASTFASQVHAGDVLHIYVAAPDPEGTIPFNQETNRLSPNLASDLQQASSIGYLVDNQGCVIFPILGPVRVEGLTTDSVGRLFERLLVEQRLVLDPTVTVQLLNFRVAVLGEVAHPAWLQVPGERLTLLEALAMTGDMTLYGQRQNVHVIREVNGQSVVGEVDLTSAQLFDSPYYYLQQNDVVFVEPNRRKKREYRRSSQVMNYIHLGVSVGSLTSNTVRTIYSIMRKY